MFSITSHLLVFRGEHPWLCLYGPYAFLTYYTYTCPHALGHKNWNLGTPNHFFHVFNKPVTSRVHTAPIETVYRRVTQHQNCLEFFWTLPWLFLEIHWLQNAKRIFPISLTVPQILVGNEGHPKVPDGEKLVSSVTRVRRAAGGKIQRVYPCSHVQSSHWCADFSWWHMQTGSRNPPKPEVVITGRREDIPTWSQRLRSVRITKMLMRGAGSRAKRAKKIFSRPLLGGPGKVIN